MLETRFIKQQFKPGEFTDQNSLASALMTKPEIIDTLIYAFNNEGAKGGFGDNYGVMQYLTRGMGATGTDYKLIGNNTIEWPLVGRLQKAITISGAVTPVVAGVVGRGFTRFVVPFAERYFAKGFVCKFENGSNARVMTDPYQSGNNWCYTFEIQGNNPNESIPTASLAVGKEVGWSYTGYGEDSSGGGSVQATPMWFRNQMSTHRMSYGMTGSAKTDVIVFEIDRTSPGGSKTTKRLWMPEQWWQYMRQWVMSVERHIWDSRYNRMPDGTITMKDENGRPIPFMAGLEEQVSGSNHIVTADLNIGQLQNMLIDITDQAGADNQKRMLITGHGGHKAFHDVMQAAGQTMTQVTEPGVFIHKLEGNKLAFGAQYTTYRGFYGSEFTVVNHPLFNDTSVYTKRVGPYKWTEQSYKMFFLDLSDYNGSPNIQLIAKGAGGESRQFKQWYTAGGTTPNWEGAGNLSATGMMRSHDRDSFQLYTLSEFMVQLRNPLSCGLIEIRPSDF